MGATHLLPDAVALDYRTDAYPFAFLEPDIGGTDARSNHS